MPEWSVSQIVSKRDRFGKVFVETKLKSNTTRNLRHLKGMSDSSAEEVGLSHDKYLSLMEKSAKGSRM